MGICRNCGKAIKYVTLVWGTDAWVHVDNHAMKCAAPVATPLVFHSLAEQRAIQGEI